MRKWIVDLAAIVFMLCSVTATGFYIMDLRHSRAAEAAALAPRPVTDWQSYALSGHRIGSASAPVQMVVFADYQCPACRKLHATIAQLERDGNPRAAIVYRHLPLTDIHPHAIEAAVAAECAADAGRFGQMHDVLYDNQDSLGRVPWTRLAAMSGVHDTAAFSRCMRDSSRMDAIRADMRAAQALHIDATPTILANGKAYTGTRPVDTVAAWLTTPSRR